jgi:glycosyltransferase involved in cell wall biosynthesis
MKICWVDEHLLYFTGGVKWVLEMSSRINADVFVTKALYENKLLFNKRGVTVYEYSKTSINNKRYWIFYPYFVVENYFKLKGLLKNYDVIISSNPTTSLVASFLKKKTIFVFFEPNPWVYSPDYIKGLSPVLRFAVKLLNPVIKAVDKWFMKRADRIVTLDSYRAKQGEEIYGRHVDVIPIGVDTELFNKKVVGTKKWEGKQIILHVATYLTPMKGTRFIIEAMPKIIKEIPNVHLLILNAQKQWEERAELLELAHSLYVDSYIEFVSKIKEEDLPYYYSLAKVIVQPSLYISAYTSFAEGGACGTPGVAFDGINADEVIVDGETGFITPSGDVGILADKIIELLKNPELCKEMGSKARERIVKLFSWERNAELMMDIIEQL